MSDIRLARPWLTFDLGRKMQVLSWSINQPGYTLASRLLWREVKNKDLSPDMDVSQWVEAELRDQNAQDAVLMLTSRDIRNYEQSLARVGDVTAQVVATVGLSNAERVGQRVDYTGHNWGTINIGVRLNVGLNQAALLEAMSIAVQARTAAVMDAGFVLPTGIATGTGTDCVAIAADTGDQIYAGLHTEIGEAVGRAVYDAVHVGALGWIKETEPRRRAKT
jgi:adenosylcobinamide amidohydrolase